MTLVCPTLSLPPSFLVQLLFTRFDNSVHTFVSFLLAKTFLNTSLTSSAPALSLWTLLDPSAHSLSIDRRSSIHYYRRYCSFSSSPHCRYSYNCRRTPRLPNSVSHHIDRAAHCQFPDPSRAPSTDISTTTTTLFDLRHCHVFSVTRTSPTLCIRSTQHNYYHATQQRGIAFRSRSRDFSRSSQLSHFSNSHLAVLFIAVTNSRSQYQRPTICRIPHSSRKLASPSVRHHQTTQFQLPLYRHVRKPPPPEGGATSSHDART